MKTRDLPPRMHFKDGGYYRVVKNKWTFLGTNLKEARLRYSVLEHGLAVSQLPSWHSMDKYVYETLWRAKKNAKLRGIEFSLSRHDYNTMVERARGRCEVTEIPFEITAREGCERRPFAPSIDRKDSSKGYTADNCRLVCGMVNTAIGAWGDDVFWFMVTRAKRKHRGRELNLEGSLSDSSAKTIA